MKSLGLKVADVDFKKSVLRVLDAKNDKDRLVYISNDMCYVLQCYLNKVNEFSVSQWLFPSGKQDTHIHKTTVDGFFNHFVRIANIGNKQFHPVPHSLRHTYVVHRVDSWIQGERQYKRRLKKHRHL